MEVGATSSKLVIRSTSGVSMHSAATSHGVDGPGCARLWPSHVQRDTNVRRDARVWAQPKWFFLALVAQQAEQPPCKRQAARSSRRRGRHQTCRVRLTGRTPLFQGGDAGSNPARDARTRSPRRAHASRVEIGRNDRAAPEPVTGWIFFWGCSSTLGRAAALQAAGCRFKPHLHQLHCLVNSAARVPACLAGSRGFESRTGRQNILPR